MDCSNSESGQVLNTPEVKDAVIARYSKVVHPTLTLIFTRWYEFAGRNNVELKHCLGWKCDFKGAFAQLDIQPESCPLLSIDIGNELALIYHSGLYGWLGFPMAFGVLTRACERKANNYASEDTASGPVDVYVDDAMAISLAERARYEQQRYSADCEIAMGPKAMNYGKEVAPTTRLEILGWLVDLIFETFQPSDKAARKLTFAFVIVAGNHHMCMNTYQMLASLADRYSHGILGMRPFVFPLHEMSRRFRDNEFIKRKPSSAAMMRIQMWKAVAALALQRDPRLVVPMRSLMAHNPDSTEVFVTTDASPTGLGVALYAPGDKPLLAWKGFVFPFATNEFQNAHEYLGLLMALCVVDWYRTRYQRPMSRVHWTNDNKAALTWAANNKCNSLASQIAFYGVAWKQLSAQLVLTGVQHIPGVTMGNIDSVSRQLLHTMPMDLEFPLTHVQLAMSTELLTLCNPTTTRDLMAHHDAFATVVRLMTKE